MSWTSCTPSTPPPATGADPARPVRRTNRPVWVKLTLVYPQMTFPPRQFHHDDHTITITGDAPGELHAWYRTTTGDWLGLVSFSILYASGNPSAGLCLTDQLVAAEALRPRVYGADRRR